MRTLTEAQRQRCADAGIPVGDIERIDEAVGKFNSSDIRDHVVNTLVEAWKADRTQP